MPHGKANPPDVRAEAEALLLVGHRQAEVCKLTGLPKQTVSSIAAHLGPRLANVAPIPRPIPETDIELIMGYFRAALRAMIAQAEVMGDPDYCRTQSIAEVASAHGILGDKLAGISAAAQALGLIGATGEFREALPDGTRSGAAA